MMATSSRAASFALLVLALLCQSCPAAADADCKAEEQEDESALLQAEAVAGRRLQPTSSTDARAAEAALLAHRSAGAGADGQVQPANNTDDAVAGKAPKQCGAIFIAESWTCCLDVHGNGIGAAPGSTCCLSPVTGGVLACGAGSVCNPNSGLCFAPGSEICGDVACAPGTVCISDGICVVPGTAGTTEGAGSEGDNSTNGTAD